MIRKGSAQWRGALKDGSGTVSTESGVVKEARYGFKTRFEGAAGTNPEELIAAAHAACFSMALSAKLEQKPDSIQTVASVTLENLENGWAVTQIHLDVTADVPGITREAFEAAAHDAKLTCPISRLLNTKITMEAKLV